MSLKDRLLQDYYLMLKYRKAAGYSTGSDEIYIPSFINFCGEKYPDAELITKEMVDAWLAFYSFRKAGTQMNVIGIIRHFTNFLNSIGKDDYVPDEDYGIHRERYVPYIFNDNEMRCLFNTFDAATATVGCPQRAIILPVLFRMMYCCGMRPGEPIRLRREDVNLTTGDIYIRQSKRNKDRHIIMAEDLRLLCIQYDGLAGPRDWFFQRSDGSPFSSSWTLAQFHSCWKRSSLLKRGNPRPYDLRHCFATRNIMNWIDNGRDVMTLLPYLSTYMGQTKFSHTLYYVHLLPDRLLKSANIDWERFDIIYREDLKYEES